MLIPIRTNYRMRHTPWANYAIIAANVVLYMIGFNGGSDRPVDGLLLHPTAPQLYQFVSCIFLHANIQHLLGNMVFLWVFGNAVNDRFGNLGYLAFYLAGGIVAGIGYVLLSGTAPVLGASGAIAAVAGTYLVLLPRARVTLLIWFWIITTFEISSLYFLLIQFVWDTVMTLQGSLGGGASAGGGIAYAAHSSGYAFGIIVAGALLAAKVIPPNSFDLLSMLKLFWRRKTYQRMVHRGMAPFSGGAARGAFSRKIKVKSVHSKAGEGQLTLRKEISDALRQNNFPLAGQKYVQLTSLDPDAVLSLQAQLDVANHLMSDEHYHAAAGAYELFLKHYETYEHRANIYLMLGILYNRYLKQYNQAADALQQAVDSLSDQAKLKMAQTELEEAKKNL